MRDCEFVQANIDDSIDGLLDGAAQAQFDDHLARCGSCAALAAGERRMTLELATLNDLANQIARNGISASQVAQPGWSRWRIAAAIALFAVGGFAAIQTLRKPATTMESNGPPIALIDSIEPEPVQTVFTLPEGDTRLSVRVESDNPRIHMYWIYETVPPPSVSADHQAPGEVGPGNAVPDTSRS